MPAVRIDGDSSTSTRVSRASYCSDRLRVNRGHASAPGMRSASAANIWHPLQMPSPKVSSRWKKSWKPSVSRSLKSTERAQPSPAPSVSP